jgi:tetratricopeptide (TPR) repeat protein
VEKDRKADNKDLDPNQKRLRNRLLVLIGHTYFVDRDYSRALDEYKRAVAFRLTDYYALASVAQCLEFLGDASAREYWERCLSAIEKSEDFSHKRERITRSGIGVLAAFAAQGCGDAAKYDHWANEARELLGGDLSVDGLAPKFFSLSTKRLVRSEQLLRELDQVAPRQRRPRPPDTLETRYGHSRRNFCARALACEKPDYCVAKIKRTLSLSRNRCGFVRRARHWRYAGKPQWRRCFVPVTGVRRLLKSAKVTN